MIGSPGKYIIKLKDQVLTVTCIHISYKSRYLLGISENHDWCAYKADIRKIVFIWGMGTISGAGHGRDSADVKIDSVKLGRAK